MLDEHTLGESSLDNRSRLALPETIVKRDGRVVPFDIELIENALYRCFASFGRTSVTPVPELARRVVNIIVAKGGAITVESVQDIVEMVLQAAGEFEAAKRYILYRAEHTRTRQERPIPEDIRAAFDASAQYFPTPLQQFQFFDKYSRFDYQRGRRETWVETVNRTVKFLYELAGNRLEAETYDRIRRGILEMKVMPSMRLLAMAGPAARRSNITLYNCSYQPVESIDSFVEALIISMSGCGVGFSVERQYVEQFPRIKRQTGRQAEAYIVPDSAEGWADALRLGLQTWFEGGDLKFDLSQLRGAGTPLKTKGGRASGPEPLRAMLEFVRSRVLSRQGGFLRALDAHDLMCVVGNAAVSGGVRRTAMISLFDYDDEDMRHAKDGDFERENSQRWNANNSAVWPEGGLSQLEVARQVLDMVESGRGEPGIFNRQAALDLAPARRKTSDENGNIVKFGTNPCVTGDTWVAVADGRGRARMIDLVQQGKDVDVYTVKEGQLVVRTMRNPRKTGTNTPVYKVTFTDGTHIRVTPNHKFILNNGEVVEAVHLAPNDSLVSMTVNCLGYDKNNKTAAANYDCPKTYRMVKFSDTNRSEHRFLYEQLTGVKLDKAQVLHHKDFNSLNNRLDNLVPMSEELHIDLHNVSGGSNPNALDVTNEQLEAALIAFIADLGYRPSVEEYQQFAKVKGLPQSFQKYRQDHFGGSLQDALIRIAKQLGVNQPLYVKASVKQSSLPVHYKDGLAHVRKNCEYCGKEFEVAFRKREIATCSYSCATSLYYKLNGVEVRRQSLKNGHYARKEQRRQQQVTIYNDLVFELGRHPMKKEWQERCREKDISPEISRVSSPFRYWNELEEVASTANHRVLAVELDGCEDVYNGTVDDTHTFFSIGCERVSQSGRTEMSYILSKNCGEIILPPWSFCNLSAVVARQDDTYESLQEKVELATLIGSIQSMATNFPGLRPQWKQNCEEERLLGVDITGQLDSPAAQDAGIKSRLRDYAIEVNRNAAQQLGINQSAAVSCVKPSGNCRPWYSLTSTSAGLLTLQELFEQHPDDKQWANLPGNIYALQGEQNEPIVRTFNNGESPTLRIKMSYGLTVESTPQHRWFVSYRYDRTRKLQKHPVNQWVAAQDLRPDDVLEVAVGAYNNEQHAPLYPVNALSLKMRGKYSPIKQPSSMNEDLAWLLGYLWGDGSMSPGGFRIRFIDERVENLHKAQRILQAQFGLEAAVYAASGKRKAMTLEIASMVFWHWLIRNNIFKYYADRIDLIPRCVRASATSDIIAFIAGLLDSDGWSGLTKSGNGRLCLSTADPFFARHVQDVAWSVGIGLGCSLNALGKNLQRQRQMYLMAMSIHVKPAAFATLLRNSTKLTVTSNLPDFRAWEWQSEKPKSKLAGKILNIEAGEFVPTYDVEVANNHWFYAGAVKSHNSSQLLDCASGLHARWAPYYIRNVRVAAHSPIYKVLRDEGVPMDPENGQTRENANTWVIHFPVKAPETAVTRNGRTALEQCDYWLQNKVHWTEHNPSVTITYKPDEVLGLMNWIWEHRQQLGGMAFLPTFDAQYAQLPYIEITAEEYHKLAAAFPQVDFSKVYRYETEDLTTAAQELACSAGTCEVEV